MGVDGDPKVAIEECDAILRECAGNLGHPEVRRVMAYTLVRKAYCLAELGDRWDAEMLCAEVAERFADSEDPDIREQVTFALSAQSSLMLARHGALDEAIALTDELIARLWTEPPESLAFLAETCITTARRLMGHPNPTPLAILIFGGEVSLNAAARAWGRLPQRQRARFASAERLARLVPAPVVRQRRRGEQALKLCTAVELRLGDEDDEDLAALAARAKLFASMSQMMLGRVRDSAAQMEAIHTGENMDVARAFERIAAEDARMPGPFGLFGLLSGLRQRAEALVGSDPDLARFAYEESVASHLPQPRPWPVRLAVRLFRP